MMRRSALRVYRLLIRYHERADDMTTFYSYARFRYHARQRALSASLYVSSRYIELPPPTFAARCRRPLLMPLIDIITPRLIRAAAATASRRCRAAAAFDE